MGLPGPPRGPERATGGRRNTPQGTLATLVTRPTPIAAAAGNKAFGPSRRESAVKSGSNDVGGNGSSGTDPPSRGPHVDDRRSAVSIGKGTWSARSHRPPRARPGCDGATSREPRPTTGEQSRRCRHRNAHDLSTRPQLLACRFEGRCDYALPAETASDEPGKPADAFRTRSRIGLYRLEVPLGHRKNRFAPCRPRVASGGRLRPASITTRSQREPVATILGGSQRRSG